MTQKFTQNKSRVSYRGNKHNAVEEIIRVDHAGEYGAKRIYLGQLAALVGDTQIQHMYEQELEHLKYFEEQMLDRKVRPTMLYPIWHFGAYAMGYITAKMGKKAAMACTVAVEDVIGHHYSSQHQILKDSCEHDLTAKISQFRNEELEHHDTALKEGAEEARGYHFLKTVIAAITKTAISISKKL